MIRDFKDLVAWQKGMDIVEHTYLLVRKLPKEEIYALSDQMRRSAVSIPSNIAEGQMRNSSKEFLHFLSIAKGSLGELETQILLGKRIGYFVDADIQSIIGLIAEEYRILRVLIVRLEEKENNN